MNTGICSQCIDDGVFIAAPQCMDCNESCRKCTGTADNECTACYTGKYLSPTNTCVSTCPDGFYGDSSDWECHGKKLKTCKILKLYIFNQSMWWKL